MLYLYIATFLTIVGFGMVFPLLPFYGERFGLDAVGLGLLAAAFSLAQFLVAPLLGRLSDRFGRKPILAWALGGTALSFFMFGLANSVPLLFISRIIHGIASAGVFPIAAAYIGDVTQKETRVKYMSKLNATFALGFIIGPVVAGVLAPLHPALPFLAAGAVSFFTMVFLFVFLPESLTQKSESIVLKEGLVNIRAMGSAFLGDFGLFFLFLFAWAFAISNLQVAFPLFTQEKFSFTESHVGFVFGGIGVIAATVQWFFLDGVVRVLRERSTILWAVVLMGVGQFAIGFSPSVALLLLFTGLSTIGSAALRPTINAVLSKETHEGQGTTMGLAFSFESLGRTIGPIVGGVLISVWSAQSQFALTGLLMFFGAILFLFHLRRHEEE
ncbi:MAG: MFS transporter [Candidatus Wildermuthbacteria bacterium]|nr:MFS transporter [Candidatus Wildermuthbacteria bacterium]